MEPDDQAIRIDETWREHRSYLTDLAFRMLGRIQDAEDVVQEAFTRLLSADLEQIDEVRAWLIVVVSRLCLDQLRSSRVRTNAHAGSLDEPTPVAQLPTFPDPADRVTLDDTVRLALLVVVEQLTPAERAVFVLHDVFQLPFERVSQIVGRAPAACRQLASRARRHIEAEAGSTRFDAVADEHHQLATEFIAACTSGNVERLARVLDPDVVGDVDLGPDFPPRAPLHGRDVISRGIMGFYGPRSGTTLVSYPILGQPGVLAFSDRRLVGILSFKLRAGLVIDVHAIADPRKLDLASRQLALLG